MADLYSRLREKICSSSGARRDGGYKMKWFSVSKNPHQNCILTRILLLRIFKLKEFRFEHQHYPCPVL